VAGKVVDLANRKLLRGGTIGERIKQAREGKKLSKSALGRLVGAGYRRVHAWETNESSPDAHYLRKLAEVLPVTLEELLAVAAGQDPPFEAWPRFLAQIEADGDRLTRGERIFLQSLALEDGSQPTVGNYLALLATYRQVRKP
jgi:transcriptional regulator with XRE-family HTH domain